MTNEGGPVSAVTVRKVDLQMEKNNLLESHHHHGRPSTITSEIAAFMDSSLDEDEELSSAEIRRLIARKFGMSLSSATIR